MKIKLTTLVVVLIALMGEVSGDWKIQEKFLSSFEDYENTKKDTSKESFDCGKSLEINNYDPPYLHLVLSNNLNYKKGYM